MQYKILLLAGILFFCHVCHAQNTQTIQLLDKTPKFPSLTLR